MLTHSLPYLYYARYGLTVLLIASSCACSYTLSNPEAKTQSAPVEIQHAGLLQTTNDEYQLGLSLRNNSQQRVWVNVYFQTPLRQDDCLLSSELEPRQAHTFACPQKKVFAEANYPIDINVYSNLAQTQILDNIITSLRFDSE